MEHHTRTLSKLVTGWTEELLVTPLFLKLLVRHSWSVECHPTMDMNFGVLGTLSYGGPLATLGKAFQKELLNLKHVGIKPV